MKALDRGCDYGILLWIDAEDHAKHFHVGPIVLLFLLFVYCSGIYTKQENWFNGCNEDPSF